MSNDFRQLPCTVCARSWLSATGSLVYQADLREHSNLPIVRSRWISHTVAEEFVIPVGTSQCQLFALRIARGTPVFTLTKCSVPKKVAHALS